MDDDGLARAGISLLEPAGQAGVAQPVADRTGGDVGQAEGVDGGDGEGGIVDLVATGKREAQILERAPGAGGAELPVGAGRLPIAPRDQQLRAGGTGPLL